MKQILYVTCIMILFILITLLIRNVYIQIKIESFDDCENAVKLQSLIQGNLSELNDVDAINTQANDIEVSNNVSMSGLISGKKTNVTSGKIYIGASGDRMQMSTDRNNNFNIVPVLGDTEDHGSKILIKPNKEVTINGNLTVTGSCYVGDAIKKDGQKWKPEIVEEIIFEDDSPGDCKKKCRRDNNNCGTKCGSFKYLGYGYQNNTTCVESCDNCEIDCKDDGTAGSSLILFEDYMDVDDKVRCNNQCRGGVNTCLTKCSGNDWEKFGYNNYNDCKKECDNCIKEGCKKGNYEKGIDILEHEESLKITSKLTEDSPVNEDKCWFYASGQTSKIGLCPAACDKNTELSKEVCNNRCDDCVQCKRGNVESCRHLNNADSPWHYWVFGDDSKYMPEVLTESSPINKEKCWYYSSDKKNKQGLCPAACDRAGGDQSKCNTRCDDCVQCVTSNFNSCTDLYNSDPEYHKWMFGIDDKGTYEPITTTEKKDSATDRISCKDSCSGNKNQTCLKYAGCGLWCDSKSKQTVKDNCDTCKHRCQKGV